MSRHQHKVASEVQAFPLGMFEYPDTLRHDKSIRVVGHIPEIFAYEKKTFYKARDTDLECSFELRAIARIRATAQISLTK